MAPNPFRIISSILDRKELSRALSSLRQATSGMTSRLRKLEDYVPIEMRRRTGDDAVQYLSPAEVTRIYSQLPAVEKDAISEHIKTAASDGLTTMEGFTPRAANPTHRAVGRLVFQDSVEDQDGPSKPLHNVLVELWDRDFGSDDILSRGRTDRDGRFELWYDPADAGKFDRPDLELRIYEVSHFYKRSRLQYKQKIVYRIEGDENVTAETYDFGECPVPYWQYDSNRSTPRLLVVANSTPPQSFAPSRSLVMALELAPIELIKRKHLALNFLSGSHSLQEIQKDYPANLTIDLERQDPGSTRSDEYFGERILNGMTASILDADPRFPPESGRYWVHHHWNSYPQNGEYAAPNVDIYLELTEQGAVLPVEIVLEFRKQGDHSARPEMLAKVSYTKDHPQWKQAKRVARVSAALHAELDVHLAQTHLNLEQYAVAAYRNLRESPLRLMLMPHLKEVVLINQEADRWLLGEKGFITRTQALTAEAIDDRLRQVLGTLDWKNWRPRKPICKAHDYAYAANLFWGALNEYVDQFFVEHETAIRAHWYEVHRFSQDLVDHSVPFFLCGHLRHVLAKTDGEDAGDSGSSPGNDANALNRIKANGKLPFWYETSERMDLLNRPNGAHAKKAVQAITETDDPQEQDIENLKQVCRYLIFHATFFHYWMNSKQLDDGGELAYSGLGLRYGKDGVMQATEDDESVMPPPELATEQLWFAHALSKTNFGFILANEDWDIPAGLREALRTREKRFLDLGLDIRKVPSRLNI